MDEEGASSFLQRAEGIVRDHYDLGEFLSVREIHGGYINRSFRVDVRAGDRQCRYLVRRYNPSTPTDQIEFEHAVIGHLRKNGFSLAAGVIPTKDAGTYVEERRRLQGRIVARWWAVFAFSKGEHRYSFADTDLSAAELTSSARTLARLHEAGREFIRPPGAHPAKSKIRDYLPTFRQVYSEYGQAAGETRFDRCFLDHRHEILQRVEENLIADSDLDGMCELPIHGDFHQGNLTYEGSQVVGVFDFDWTSIDLRLFDLAQALLYFCARWDGEQAGSLDLEKYELFLGCYNECCEVAASPGPLSVVEKADMPLMLAATNLYVLDAIVRSFYDTENPTVEEWLMALNHYLEMMRWIEAAKDRIAERTHLACGPRPLACAGTEVREERGQ